MRAGWRGLRAGWRGLRASQRGLRASQQGLRASRQGLRASQREDVRTDVRTDGISRHSTGLRPLSGPLPKKRGIFYGIIGSKELRFIQPEASVMVA